MLGFPSADSLRTSFLLDEPSPEVSCRFDVTLTATTIIRTPAISHKNGLRLLELGRFSFGGAGTATGRCFGGGGTTARLAPHFGQNCCGSLSSVPQDAQYMCTSVGDEGKPLARARAN